MTATKLKWFSTGAGYQDSTGRFTIFRPAKKWGAWHLLDSGKSSWRHGYNMLRDAKAAAAQRIRNGN